MMMVRSYVCLHLVLCTLEIPPRKMRSLHSMWRKCKRKKRSLIHRGTNTSRQYDEYSHLLHMTYLGKLRDTFLYICTVY